ncbi:MAG: serine/threonine protein kinase [Pirellulales bacterium]|nr:serine/threonine protein kinase [Pirellulales bacterium]
MPSGKRSVFEKCALASGLLDEMQLDDARATVRWSQGDEADPSAPPSDRQLAERLVEMNVLNAWQAKQLLDSRTKFDLNQYRIVDSLGQGGMGQVYKAQDSESGRIVAVKVLPRDKSTPEAIANFTREIRTLASLDHPRLVAALNAGRDGKVHFLVTEYVPGTDLRKLVRREGPLGMTAAANIIYQAAEGLEYAHHQGMIHRDVKPGNVLVTPEGEAKLSDLGLAGPLEGGQESDPRFGKIVGTADYLSPDQIASPWSPTPAWDIYALGCTLYYAVTGKVPFPGGTTADKAMAHCKLRPLDPRRLNPRLTAEFVDMMADMMAKDAAQRIPSAAAVRERLKPWLPGGPLADAATTAVGSATRSPSPLDAPPDTSVPPPPLAPPRVAARPIAMPPLRRPAPRAEKTPLADTKLDFPELPQVSDSSESSASPPALYLDSGDEEDSSTLEMQIPEADSWSRHLQPALLLMLIPLTLIAGALFVWGLIELLR